MTSSWEGADASNTAKLQRMLRSSVTPSWIKLFSGEEGWKGSLLRCSIQHSREAGGFKRDSG